MGAMARDGADRVARTSSAWRMDPRRIGGGLVPNASSNVTSFTVWINKGWRQLPWGFRYAGYCQLWVTAQQASTALTRLPTATATSQWPGDKPLILAAVGLGGEKRDVRGASQLHVSQPCLDMMLAPRDAAQLQAWTFHSAPQFPHPTARARPLPLSWGCEGESTGIWRDHVSIRPRHSCPAPSHPQQRSPALPMCRCPRGCLAPPPQRPPLCKHCARWIPA